MSWHERSEKSRICFDAATRLTHPVSLCVCLSASQIVCHLLRHIAQRHHVVVALLLLFTLQAAFTCGMTVTLTVVSVCCLYLFTCGSIVVFDSWLGMFPSFWRAILSVCQFLRAKHHLPVNLSILNEWEQHWNKNESHWESICCKLHVTTSYTLNEYIHLSSLLLVWDSD